MKHILPVLTITALAAAASAQTAPAAAPAAKQSLSYNRVIASWVHGSDSSKGVSVTGQAKLNSALYVSATTTDIKNSSADTTTATLGYAYSLPHFAGLSTDLNVEIGYKSAGIALRSLIGGGVEIDLGYTHGAGSTGTDTTSVGASYNLGFLAKGLSINASYAHQSSGGSDTTSVGLAYNF